MLARNLFGKHVVQSHGGTQMNAGMRDEIGVFMIFDGVEECLDRLSCSLRLISGDGIGDAIGHSIFP